MPTLPRLDRVSDTECGHSDDSAGEKEAKRQRSEPTTPVSTSGRLPYDYDAVMGITKVGTKEVEGFGEDLDTSEYHDAAEEPSRKDESDDTVEPQRLSDFQGGYGSSSLKECIELLTATTKNAPAPLDSGDGQKAKLFPRTSRQNPGTSRQKSLIPWVSRDIPNFLAPTPSRGRPPPHQKISGLKSLGLGSFFVPDQHLKNLLRLFFRNNLTMLKITSGVKITLKGHFRPCFEGHFPSIF